MKNTRQSGSAHIIIIICLVLALATALGWIFWQNFLQTSDNDLKQVDNTNDKKVSKTEKADKSYCAPLEKLCFTYPEDWSLKAKEETVYDQHKVDNITLTNSDEDVVLRLRSGIDGLGGTCDPEDNTDKNFQTVQSKQLSIKNVGYSEETKEFQSPYVHAITGILKYGSKYSPEVIITTSKSVAAIGQHEFCASGYREIVTGRNVNLGEQNGSIYSGSVAFGTKFLGTNPTEYASYDEAKKVLDQDTYQETFEIIKSSKYE